MEQIMVSIIVPVYNVQEYLKKCVESVLAQTYRDFELILVDDGSTDNSPSICDSYLVREQVHVIHKENGGPSSARNAGLDIAQGKYIYFADSDDYIEPDLLEKTVSLMEEKQLDCVSFGMVKETPEGELLEKIHYVPRELHICTEEDRLEFQLKYLLNYRIGWEACNRVYRGDIIRDNRLRFVSERKFAEDMLFTFCYWLHARSCMVLHEIYYHYVQRGNSLMGASRKRNVLPQTYALSRDAYGFVCQRDLPLIREHFIMIHLHLLEWQTRPHVADNGIDWVKQELESMDHRFFLPNGISLEEAYRKSLIACGRWDGFLTVAVSVPDDTSWEKVPSYIRNLQEQTLLKLDILLLVREERVLEAPDPRIRQIVTTVETASDLIRTAFQESYGEYLYFADLDEPKPGHFLCRGCDVMKYNNCGTVIFTSGQGGFTDSAYAPSRYHFREEVKKKKIPSHMAMVRTDLLENSGLSCMEDLRDYMTDILLADHVLMMDEGK